MLHGSISTWSHDQIIPEIIRHEDHINVQLWWTNGNFSNHIVIVITNVIFGNKCTRWILIYLIYLNWPWTNVLTMTQKITHVDNYYISLICKFTSFGDYFSSTFGSNVQEKFCPHLQEKLLTRLLPKIKCSKQSIWLKNWSGFTNFSNNFTNFYYFLKSHIYHKWWYPNVAWIHFNMITWSNNSRNY